MHIYIFFIYIKKSKKLSVKYYQEKKERLQKKACERHQNLSKQKKEKNQQYSCEWYKKISQKMNNKSIFTIEKSIIE